MARAKSPEKRQALLEAAVAEVAVTGLAASTAKIAERAGVASGTLFTYFSSKEDLLNAVYLMLKSDVYGRMDAGFPDGGSLQVRVRHLWSESLHWSLGDPERRRVSMLLTVSDVLTPKTRAEAAAAGETVGATLRDLEERGVKRGLPAGFATATMYAMQEVALDLVTRQKKNKEEMIERAFEVFWRTVR